MTSAVPLLNHRRVVAPAAAPMTGALRRSMVVVGAVLVQLVLAVGAVAMGLGLVGGQGGGVGPDRPPAPEVRPQPGF